MRAEVSTICSYPFLTGFESTYIPDAGVDSLALTRHTEFFRDDLVLVRNSGVRALRYPAPWHSIEAQRDVYEWGWMDAAMGTLHELGLDPIVDLVHHTSFPPWLEGGFVNPELPQAECSFAGHFAERYPWVRQYTVFNEPWLTAFMCGHQGVWPPHGTSPATFVPMLLNVGRAICEVSELLVSLVPHLQLIHVETCEHHKALDPELEDFVALLNERRFLMHDLVLGRLDTGHPMFPYLAEYGYRPEDVHWFQEHAARIDVLGLDYYSHSEYQFHSQGAVVPSKDPRGLACVARDYVERYGLPVMLSETNIRGYSTDRLSWLKYTVEQCDQLVADGVDFRGYCWFPFIDSTDWDSLLREARGHVDPVGIYWLDSDRHRRNSSVLSRYFTELASGKARAEDLPAFSFRPPVDDALSGFLPQMAHWEWQDPLSADKRTA